MGCYDFQNVLKTRKKYTFSGKLFITKDLIRRWYEKHNGNVVVSFSGGKDSTVLLHIVRTMYPEVPAVFLNTGLEYPEIREFVETTSNVDWVRPKLTFRQVLDKYGYPVISKETAAKIHEIQTTRSVKLWQKRMFGDNKGNGKLAKKWRFLLEAPFSISARCCYHLKKAPSTKYLKNTKKAAMLGMMGEESRIRFTNVAIDINGKTLNPLMHWTTDDIWQYIHENGVAYCSIYDTGVNRTGCMFCMFGIHLEKNPNRFERMRSSHPKLYDYCINNLGIGKVLDYINVRY